MTTAPGTSPTGTTVALALGGGGARGYAHIGVLKALAERNCTVVGLAGTSMGALVGGLYAAGALDQFEEWAMSLNQRKVLRMMDPALGQPGAVRLERVLLRISEMLDDAQIEELQIRYVAIATDLNHWREVWFRRGPVDVAIRASIAIPSVITPVMIHGRLLVDGGVLNPVPLEALAGMDADLVVSVDLSGPATGATSLRPVTHESAAPEGGEPWLKKLRGMLGLRPRTDTESVEERVLEDLPEGLRTFDVLNGSLEAMQALITRYRRAAHPADVEMTIPRNSCGVLDFHRAPEMIELGYRTAVEALDRAGV